MTNAMSPPAIRLFDLLLPEEQAVIRRHCRNVVALALKRAQGAPDGAATEPGYTPDDVPMPAKAPRAMLYPTRSQVENGYVTGQPTVKRTTKPGPKTEPKASRRYRGAGQGRWKGDK